MTGDDLVSRSVRNCAAAYAAMAAAMDRPVLRTHRFSLADLGLLVAQSPNNATLLEPLGGAADPVLDEIEAFFGARPGGGYEIWSAWPTPDLADRGFERWRVPTLARSPGGEAPPPPRELALYEATDALAVRDAEALWIEAFECIGSEPGSLADQRLLEHARIWVGSVDGRPVSSALAYRSDGVVGIFCVATATDARRRGYGAAATWAAALSDPSLPAVLQASPDGLPVYERMGFVTISTFTLWEAQRRPVA
jgi:hypothetical protein